MKALTHITAGCTATRVLVVAILLIAAVAGTSGIAAAEPMDGKGNDVYPPPTQNSLDWTGLTAEISAFPIDNVTVFSADYHGRGGGSGKPSF